MLELQNWNWLYNATDKLTKGWLTHGARLLQQVIASAKSSEEAMQVNDIKCCLMHNWQRSGQLIIMCHAPYTCAAKLSEAAMQAPLGAAALLPL